MIAPQQPFVRQETPILSQDPRFDVRTRPERGCGSWATAFFGGPPRFAHERLLFLAAILRSDHDEQPDVTDGTGSDSQRKLLP
jgi:hypothetical protein